MHPAKPAITTSTAGRKMLIQFKVDATGMPKLADYHADGKGQLPLTLIFKNIHGQSDPHNLQNGARTHVKLTVKKREIVPTKPIEQPPAMIPILPAAAALPPLTSLFHMTPQSSVMEMVETLIEANFITVEQFLLDLRNEASLQEYNLLVKNEYIVGMVEEAAKMYLHHQHMAELTDLTLDYLALSKNYTYGVDILPTRLTLAHCPRELAQRWKRLQSDVKTASEDSIKVLKYLEDKSNPFLMLKMRLQADELSEVVNKVHELSIGEPNAFFFLTNYLYMSCLNLQKSGAGLKEIEYLLSSSLSNLLRQHPAPRPLSANDALLGEHPTWTAHADWNKATLDLADIQRKKRQTALQNFILQRVHSARSSYGAFASLIRAACGPFGHHLRAGVRVRDMGQRRAVQRIKEKILDGLSARYRAEINLHANPSSRISQFTETELSQYGDLVDTLLESHGHKLDFEVDDLLRASVSLHSVERVNTCASSLIKEASARGHRVVGVRNRLGQPSGDLIISVLVGETVGEVRLAVDFQYSAYDFNHRIRQLARSQFFSPLTTLRLANDKLNRDYLPALASLLIRLPSTVDARPLQASFHSLLNMIPVSVETNLPAASANLLTAQLTRLQAIRETPNRPILPQPRLLKHLRNAEYLHQMLKFQQAETEICVFHEEVKVEGDSSEYQIKVIAHSHQLKADLIASHGKVDQAIQELNTSTQLLLQLGQKQNREIIVDNLERHAKLLVKKGSFAEAQKMLNEALQKQKQSKKKQKRMGILYSGLGEVLQQQGKYKEAIPYFKQKVALLQNTAHKSTALSHLASALQLSGDLTESLQQYRQCLKEQERVKGKESVEYLSTEGNIGLVLEQQGNYYEAMRSYEHCLNICQRMNLKGIAYNNANFGMGSVLSGLGNYSAAITYFQKVLAEGGPELEEGVLSNIAYCYESLGEPELRSDYLGRLKSISPTTFRPKKPEEH